MRPILLVTVALALATATLAPARAKIPATSPARPPNIILILADDLGYGDLGSYGQRMIATPRLDEMASEGLRFTQFYAGSTVCAPSRSVLMTGLHTGRTSVRGNATRELQSLRPDDFTFAELLSGRGYRTGLVGKWGLGEADQPGRPSAQGFHYSFGYLNQTHAHNFYPEYLYRDERQVPLRNVVVPAGRAPGAGVATTRIDYSHDLFTEDALEFISQERDRPFFLYLSLTIPHANNEATHAGMNPPAELGMEVPDLDRYASEDWPAPEKGFAAMIARMDRDVGRILDRLRELGLAENTIVFFSSDNGPHREGGHDPDFFDSSGPLRGIKRDLYEGGIRVPMIAWGPGRVPAGAITHHIGYLGDFMATAAELAGAETPGDLDSVSLVPTLLGQTERQQEHPYLYWEFYEAGSAQAVRAGRWKAVRKPMLTGPIELYDLESDIGEERDVAARHPDVVERMRAIMAEAHVPSPDWPVPARAAN